MVILDVGTLEVRGEICENDVGGDGVIEEAVPRHFDSAVVAELQRRLARCWSDEAPDIQEVVHGSDPAFCSRIHLS